MASSSRKEIPAPVTSRLLLEEFALHRIMLATEDAPTWFEGIGEA
ncbi:hypothetical protein [Streptomyces mutabilis]|nr:hypothetical protein [Streptomyces mutabilis]